MDQILLKGIKTKKNKKIKKIEEEYEINGDKLDPLETFDSLNVHCIFETPKLVQKLVIPYILNHKNVCVNSFTGSGKTLSYVLPLLELSRSEFVRSLILVPTDTLIKQCYNVIKEVNYEGHLSVIGVFDYNKEKEEASSFISNLHDNKVILKDLSKNIILICRPETIVTLPDLKDFTNLIIDEADISINKMSMKFFTKLNQILDFNRITISVFSATMNTEVENIIGLIKNITKINIISKYNLDHRFLFGTKDNLKLISLKQIIEDGIEVPSLIFVKNLETGRSLSERIEDSAFYDGEENILDKFRMKKILYLFTTDSLGRGMDFYNVKSVINFDFPSSKTEFVHRAGRVNRNVLGQKVYTIYTIDDFEKLHYVVEFLLENKCYIPKHIKKIIEASGKSIF